MDIATIIRDRLTRHPQRRAIEFEGRWHTWAEIARIAGEIEARLTAAAVPPAASIGVVVRNRFAHAATVIGLLAAGRSVKMIYAYQSAEALAADIERLGLAAVIAADSDWTPPAVEAARRSATLGLRLPRDVDQPIEIVCEPPSGHARSGVRTTAEPALELLTSGTTGKPKDVALSLPMLRRMIASALTPDGAGDEPPVQIAHWPFTGIGGACGLVASAVNGTPYVLLEKFTVEGFVDAVKRVRPPQITLTPAGLRMILTAGVPAADLSSVKAIYGGSAHLEPEVQERFEQQYGCTVYWAYGATEFFGTIIRWDSALRDEFGPVAKRGSVGRAMPGVTIRAVDPDTGDEVGPGRQGLLQARLPDIGPDWIKTTDLVMIDADGFVFHRGRNDGAINRGGFKILPETIIDALRRHPSVADAAAVGIPDERLGQVPVAAVECVPGQAAPTEAELLRFLRDTLPTPQLPVAIKVVDALPRTPSMKVSLGELVQMFDRAQTTGRR